MTRLRRSITALLGDDPTAHLTFIGEREMTSTPSPLTGEDMPEVPLSTEEDVDVAFSRARGAQEAWAKKSPRERARLISKVADVVAKHESQLLDLVQGENGKVRSHAFEEVSDVALTAKWLGKTAPKVLSPKSVKGVLPILSKVQVNYQPLGVVGIISPWNYPLTLAISDGLAALAAGNAVVLKPDSRTVLCGIAAKVLITKAGIDPDLFQVVTGPGSKLGSAIISRSNYVMFTGSSETGKTIAKQAGENLIGCSAELGGKNALIVADDAPIGRAVRGAVKAVTSNSGQLCISIERMYVTEAVWDQFVPKFVATMKKVKVASTFSWNADMGPLVGEGHFETVKSHVDDAVSKGATVLAGGQPLPKVSPTAFAPTVLTDVTPEMTVWAEETFGPVVSIYKVSTLDEAIARANDSQYGLNASVWTRSAKGFEIGKNVASGTVNVNDGYIAAWAALDAPMGGMKNSGLGRRHGENGILKYTDPQTVAVQRIHHIAPPKGMSEKTYAKFLRAFIKTR